MKQSLLSILLFLLFGCSAKSDHEKKVQKFDEVLNDRLFESFNAFVKYNLQNNYLSQYHLLSLESFRADTFTFILTSITKENLFKNYIECNYIRSLIDSSILILDDKNNFIYNEREFNKVADLFENEPKNVPSYSTFNPLIWQLLVTKDTVVIDKYYESKFINPKLLIPNKKFEVQIN